MASSSGLSIRFIVDGVVFYALNISRERFQRSIPMHSHSSKSYEIHYISTGRGTAKINGQVYEITPGTLYVTGPHVEHEQIPHPDDSMVEYCVYLRVSQQKSRRRNCPSGLADIFLETPFWFGQDSQNVYPVMQQIIKELDRRPPGYVEQIEALLKQLVVLIIRNYSGTGKQNSPPSPVDSVNDHHLLIEEYFLYGYRNAKLEDLAALLGIGIRQTERLLRQSYGKTFQQKKTEAKMAAALILLKDHSRSITQVADELGYSSVEHFSNAFRRRYGTSPRRYRQQET